MTQVENGFPPGQTYMATKACTESATETGGYFGLDLPDYGDLYPDAIRFQSARAAIRAVLECNGIERVRIPAYICDSIIKSAVDAGVAVDTYDLDESLYPKDQPNLDDRCALVYVNYFGLCQQNIARLLKEFPNERLIIDSSQALFAAHSTALATVYSPRKFVGLPDGGLLRASPALRISPPVREDRGSIDRMQYLLMRMAYSAREGYAEFNKARISLSDNSPMAMSKLTRRLMKSVQWHRMIERRRENYLAMARMLDAINDMRWPLGENDVPMCYPFTLRGCAIEDIRTELAARNVFVATYWRDALPRITTNSVETVLVNETLFLPIDQRMQRADVEAVSRLVFELTGK